MRIARSSNAGSWLAFGTCVLPTALDLVTALSVPQSDENASWSGGGYLFNAIFVLALLSFAAVGLLIAIKGRGGVISRLLLAIGLKLGRGRPDGVPGRGHPRPARQSAGGYRGGARVVRVAAGDRAHRNVPDPAVS
ncbi:MAG: hypothetical protein ACHQEA_04845 [Gaiellales bacterium]